ncbi:Rv0361 family membrane protein [Gordonia soli]|uniref:DUF4878 domain-containing protein n=1 Tax=Gordonia soli NBRC 108243 TaxID=1223545 RepID=M0QHM2_9ACTN|nr:hypothetical protein [Gordonia soli]GAC68145.1 hypothetical protein GS4_11_04170 [Gordonia soli NBRC 108243]
MPTDRSDRAVSPGDAGGPDDPGTPRGFRAVWPFVVALVVVVIAVGAIVISYLVRPVDDRLTESAQVQHAINDAYTARNELNYGDYREATCAADHDRAAFPTEQAFVDDNLRSREANGHIVIPEIDQITVTGDRGSAQVHWHFDDHPDDKKSERVVVVRENGDWKVCTS